jgi:polysaccharide transporter, PST family
MFEFRQSAFNLIALTSIQLGNAVIPLAVYPLLLATVGSEPFSRIVVTESVIFFVLISVVYNFDIDGVAELASQKEKANPIVVSTIFSEVLIVRLAILCTASVGIIVLSPFMARETFILLISWMLVPLGYILQGAWFFQAVEQNVFHAVVVVASRLACLLLIHDLISSPPDFYLAPLIIGGTYAFGGLVLFLFTRAKFEIRIAPVSLSRIREVLIYGQEIFIGNLSVALYRNSNVLILSVFGNSSAVSTYSIAEKMIKVFQAGARPLNQLFFPKVIRALEPFRKPCRPALTVVLKYTIPQISILLGGGAVMAIIFMLFRDHVPIELSSSNTAEIVQLVLVMAASVLFGVINFMLGPASLNYLGNRRYLAKSILITGVASILSSIILIHLYSSGGAAMAFVLAEIILFAQILWVYK